MLNKLLITGFTFAFLIVGCKNSEPLHSSAALNNDVRYSIIYLIHADANYLFHDEDGKAHRADEKVLREAKSIGEQAKEGEVFIFHLKPERKILWLFPRKDRHVLHYRNGELLADKRYSPKSETSLFNAESEFYANNRVNSVADPEKVLLYFGHEIPAKSEYIYHHSQPEITVNAARFSEGIQQFLTNEKDNFDLSVLSSCNNGSPQMVNLLSPFTEYLLASPQNLHLSHIDTKKLNLLEEENSNIQQIATALAEETFQRLSRTMQTAVTLCVYDLNQVDSYMSKFYAEYEQYLSTVDPDPFEDNIDCTELPIFAALEEQTGVNRWFKPAQFGRRADSTITHSGWGCKGK